jgi:dTDP-4-amino-4,6-dideoxygalactose transaminase
VAKWRIPLSDLDYGSEEEAAVLRVLKSRWLSMGPEVQAFEKEFAEFIGAKYALAVATATAGLHLSLLALELGPGDEVIQPHYELCGRRQYDGRCRRYPRVWRHR